MNQFKTTSLADQVFEKLENDIIQGVYPRGEILTELKLVDQLGVSRTPIREALRRLEQERLIEDTGKGSRVVGITEEDLEDIMNIRQRIEGLAAYYATKNMTPEGLAQLTHIADLQDFYFDKGDAELLRQVDEQFHDTICYLSKRTVIVDTLLPLHRQEDPALPPHLHGGLVAHHQHPEGTQGNSGRHGFRQRRPCGEPHGKAYRKREKAHVGRIQKSWVRQSHRKSLRPIWSPGT